MAANKDQRTIWDLFRWIGARAGTTLSWFFGYIALIISDLDWPWLLGYIGLFVGVFVLAFYNFKIRKIAPFFADRNRIILAKQRRDGNQLLRALGLVAANDPHEYNAQVLENPRKNSAWRLWVHAPLALLTNPAKLEKHLRERLAVVSAADVRLDQLSSNEYEIWFYKQARPDARQTLEPLNSAVRWNGDWKALPIGVREDGSDATLRIQENSGTVVGGLPGGGKTAGLSTMLAHMVPDPRVQFLIWDGKGGADWEWLKIRASLYNNEDENRARVAEELESVVGIMRERVQTMKAVRGGSSIWNTGGPSEDMPLLVCVIDECQTFLDSTAIPKTDKEALEYRQRTEAAIATLVRKGRSAGIWVIVATQKPTADSLPTTIGANAASAIAFRVKTLEAEKAVLGSNPADGDPSATTLPAEPGYAVVSTENGTREAIRFEYLPEEKAEITANIWKELRRDVLGAPPQDHA